MEKQDICEKPTFQQIRQQARTTEGQLLSRQEIAAFAGLTLIDVYVIDIGGHSPVENVKAVLHVFNALTGQKLTIDDIRYGEPLPLKREG